MAEDEREAEGLFGDPNLAEATTGYMRYGGEEESSQDLEKSDKDEDPNKDIKDDEEGDEKDSKDDDEEEPEDDEEEGEEDSSKWSPELQKEYKKLQRVFTEKFKDIGAIRLKANLVDAIEKNPAQAIPELARRYGIDLGPRPSSEKKKPKEFKIANLEVHKDEDFPSYMQRTMQTNFEALAEYMKENISAAAPAEKKSFRTENSQDSERRVRESLTYLDGKYADWGMYEEKMISLLGQHPSYMDDLDSLYRTAKALSGGSRNLAANKKNKKRKKKTSSGKRPSGTVVADSKGKLMSFNEAWSRAKRDTSKK